MAMLLCRYCDVILFLNAILLKYNSTLKPNGLQPGPSGDMMWCGPQGLFTSMHRHRHHNHACPCRICANGDECGTHPVTTGTMLNFDEDGYCDGDGVGTCEKAFTQHLPKEGRTGPGIGIPVLTLVLPRRTGRRVLSHDTMGLTPHPYK